MPELPEVEAVRATLEQTLMHKRIVRVAVTLARIVRTPKSVAQFCSRLQGQTFVALQRVGKFLIFSCSGDDALIVHLRMEGQFRHVSAAEAVMPHTHVRFFLCDDSELRYRDVRQFGTMDIVPIAQLYAIPPLSHIGIDALTEAYTPEWFLHALSHKRMRIKALLLTQSFVAGLGNIYVDEVLHVARIHPAVIAHVLTTAEAMRLYEAIKTVLRAAVDAKGCTVRSYVDGRGQHGTYQKQLRVYGKQGQPCLVCGTTITKTTCAGRGTHVCLTCQPYRS